MVGLLMIEEVRKELDVTQDQVQALRKVGQSAREDRPDFSRMRDMSQEERQEMFEKMRAQGQERAKKMQEELEEVLLPGQMERLEQISVQTRGAAALEDPAIIEKLGLTQDDQDKLEAKRTELREGMRDRMREMFSGGNREGGREAFEKIREEMDEKVLAVLTPEQRTKFNEMKGEPFAMPERAGRGDRGNRGDRPDRGNRPERDRSDSDE